MDNIFRLLDKKLRLHIRKVSLTGRVFAEKQHYFLNYKDISLLRVAISHEIGLNKKLLQVLRNYAEKENLQSDPVVESIRNANVELIFILREELKALKDLGVVHLFFHDFKALFFPKAQRKFLDGKLLQFESLQKLEQEFDSRIFSLATKQIGTVPYAKIKVYRKLTNEINARYRALVSSVGNNALVRKNAEDILRLFKKLQNTELYTYMHEDISFLKDQLKEIIKNPKKNRLKALLAGVYLFTPGSFDITIYALILKNLAKVTVKRVRSRKKVKQRSSSAE